MTEMTAADPLAVSIEENGKCDTLGDAVIAVGLRISLAGLFLRSF